MATIEVTDDFVRVGEEVRPRRWLRHDIRNFLFEGDTVAGPGEWTTYDARAEYDLRLWAYRELAPWRVLRPLARRVAEWEPNVYEGGDEWDDGYEDIVSTPTPGLPGWIARHTRLPQAARSLMSVTAPPVAIYPVSIAGCMFAGAAVVSSSSRIFGA